MFYLPILITVRQYFKNKCHGAWVCKAVDWGQSASKVKYHAQRQGTGTQFCIQVLHPNLHLGLVLRHLTPNSVLSLEII